MTATPANGGRSLALRSMGRALGRSRPPPHHRRGDAAPGPGLDCLRLQPVVLAVDGADAGDRVRHHGADGRHQHRVADDCGRAQARPGDEPVYDVVSGHRAFRQPAGGGLARLFGAPLAVAVGGVSCVAAAASFAVKLPELRRQARRFTPAWASCPKWRQSCRGFPHCATGGLT